MTYQDVKALYAKHGYPFYETGTYNVNNYARRNKDLTTVDKFNDIRGVAYTDAFGNQINLEWACTTKPGLKPLSGGAMNPNGVAILIPGFYPKCWMLGRHKGEYPALVQAGAGIFKVWRDNDIDGKFDFTGRVWTDVSGLNDHTTREHQINNVGGFSEGCIVTQDDKEHQIKMAICLRSAELYAPIYSFALFQDL
jgi:hypothetical protein